MATRATEEKVDEVKVKNIKEPELDEVKMIKKGVTIIRTKDEVAKFLAEGFEIVK